jgi:hypothetical protein
MQDIAELVPVVPDVVDHRLGSSRDRTLECVTGHFCRIAVGLFVALANLLY